MAEDEEQLRSNLDGDEINGYFYEITTGVERRVYLKGYNPVKNAVTIQYDNEGDLIKLSIEDYERMKIKGISSRVKARAALKVLRIQDLETEKELLETRLLEVNEELEDLKD